MFTTFSAHMSPVNSPRAGGSSSVPTKPKRKQVTRACDACRLSRIKCDDYQPCNNCRNRGERCTNSRPWEAQSLPAAKREIERLQERVKELEKKGSSKGSSSSPERALLPMEDITEFTEPTSHVPPASHLLTRTRPTADVQRSKKPARKSSEASIHRDEESGEQLRVRRHNSSSTPCLTPSFINRMSQYLESTLQQPFPTASFEPVTASMDSSSLSSSSSSPTGFSAASSSSRPSTGTTNSSSDHVRPDLDRTQEAQFLSLFWHSYHCAYPVLDEEDFQSYYDKLWTDADSTYRHPSSLVDILLALCMQYSNSFLFGSDAAWGDGRQPPAIATDSSIVGRQLYRDSHRLLLEELQVPTVQTVQSSIFSTIYLLNAGLLNIAHTTLAITIRTAHILGLHHADRPLGPGAQPRQDLQRRIWRTISTLDGYLAVTMGFPALISESDSISDLLSSRQGELNAKLDNAIHVSNTEHSTGWLAFNLQLAKLVVTAQAAHAQFRILQAEILGRRDHSDLYSQPALLEKLAGSLDHTFTMMQEFGANVPSTLRLHRDTSVSFGFTDKPSSLEIDHYSPLWLQRQKFILEISYHHLNIALLRHFLRFKQKDSLHTPRGDAYSVLCLKHSSTLINVVHQALKHSEALTGWLFAFRCQWDAVLYLLGFVIANPVCPFNPDARRAINTAIESFAMLEPHLSIATSALSIISNLLSYGDVLLNQYREVFSRRSISIDSVTSSSAPPSPPRVPNLYAPATSDFLLDHSAPMSIPSSRGFDDSLAYASSFATGTSAESMRSSAEPMTDMSHPSSGIPSRPMSVHHDDGNTPTPSKTFNNLSPLDLDMDWMIDTNDLGADRWSSTYFPN